MGNIKLYQQPHSASGLNDVSYVVHNVLSGIVDDLRKEIIEMGELKLLLVVLGIPAYIYAWFINIGGEYELIKGIILTAIGAFTGIVIGLRYFIKLLTEWKEYKKKYK